MANNSCRIWKLAAHAIPEEKKIRVRYQRISPTRENCANILLLKKSKYECDDIDHLQEKDRAQAKITNDYATTTFKDVIPGVYCVMVMDCAANPQQEYCIKEANLTEAIIEMPPSVTPPSVKPHLRQTDKIAFSFLGASLAFAIISLLIILHLRRRGGRRPVTDLPNSPINNNETEYKRIGEPSNPKVFIIYSRDCKPHINAVKAFAEMLEKVFYFEVSYDGKDLSEIMTNQHAWIHRVNKSDKIIVVSSEGAYMQEQSWLNDKVALRNRLEEQDYFVPLLSQLSLLKRHNYRDVINVRFAYTDMQYTISDVVTLRHYEIPQDLVPMATVLNNGSEITWNQQDETCQQFQLKVEECRTFLSNNPDYIQTSLAPYDSLVISESQEHSTKRRPLHVQSTFKCGSDSNRSSLNSNTTDTCNSTDSLL